MSLSSLYVTRWPRDEQFLSNGGCNFCRMAVHGTAKRQLFSVSVTSNGRCFLSRRMAARCMEQGCYQNDFKILLFILLI